MTGNPARYDCLVLSGGGAKGSYGAGVAKALDLVRRDKYPDRKICYFGTSAGALNAAVLASSGPDALIDFWLHATKRNILGRFSGWGYRLPIALLDHYISRPQEAFSLYSNNGLVDLISDRVRLNEVVSDLVIIAVNYDCGQVSAFYKSALMEKFVEDDRKLVIDKQRMQYYMPIKDQQMLEKSLLASTAFPLAFPPVCIADEYYVDGGVANNIPTKEAAWFLRHATSNDDNRIGDVYCVKLDPPGIRKTKASLGPMGILLRTWDIAYHLRTKPLLEAWTRINNEVLEHDRKVSELIAFFAKKYRSYPSFLVEEITQGVNQNFRSLGGKISRVVAPLIEFEPSSSLGGTLDFNPDIASKNIKTGFNDAMKVMTHRGNISQGEYQKWTDHGPF